MNHRSGFGVSELKEVIPGAAMDKRIRNKLILAFSVVMLLLTTSGCGPLTTTQPEISPSYAGSEAITAAPTVTPEDTDDADAGDGTNSRDWIVTLSSLEKVDDYPLYTMKYAGGYSQSAAEVEIGLAVHVASPLHSDTGWGCSLFAVLVDDVRMLYGRNFDWRYSPALLLFTDPPDGYASASMVDLEYLVDENNLDNLAEFPPDEKNPLLQTPYWPFDGMNEHGLVVGMAAVPDSRMPHDTGKAAIGSLMVIRKMLDHAQDTHEALEILRQYNIDWYGGPTLHYLIADAGGNAVLVEFFDGEMIVLPNRDPWHMATNHLRSQVDENDDAGCWRYSVLNQQLSASGGKLTSDQALELLSDVSWEDAEMGTQWSVVYDMIESQVHVVMGRDYQNVYTFGLSGAAQPP
ncbi:MAG: C45 family peptidase [Chloroflexota bacterium]|nr:C45 family peptidase [Chloroflexota bacterium]